MYGGSGSPQHNSKCHNIQHEMEPLIINFRRKNTCSTVLIGDIKEASIGIKRLAILIFRWPPVVSINLDKRQLTRSKLL